MLRTANPILRTVIGTRRALSSSMSLKWLAGVLVLSAAACTCPPETVVKHGYARSAQYASQIQACQDGGVCDPLCEHLFFLGGDDAITACQILGTDDTGAKVKVTFQRTDTCAADDDGDSIVVDGDDGGDDGSCDDSTCDGGSDDGSDSGDDGSDSGDDGGDSGDDGGDSGDGGDGGDGGDSAIVHHAHAYAPALTPDRR